MSHNQRQNNLKMITHVAWFILAAIVVVGITAFVLNASMTKDPIGSGGFGDSFGWVTSIFTGLAFVLLAWSVTLQRMELEEVRGERNDSRTEAQYKRIEDSFFQVLSIAMEQKQRIKIADRNKLQVDIARYVGAAYSKAYEDFGFGSELIPPDHPIDEIKPFYDAIRSLYALSRSDELSDDRQEFLFSVLSGFINQPMIEVLNFYACWIYVQEGDYRGFEIVKPLDPCATLSNDALALVAKMVLWPEHVADKTAKAKTSA